MLMTILRHPLFWFGVVLGVLVYAGIRDFWRVMTWESGDDTQPSLIGLPVFYLLLAAAVVSIIALWLFLILTGKYKEVDRDDDHLYHMPSR